MDTIRGFSPKSVNFFRFSRNDRGGLPLPFPSCAPVEIGFADGRQFSFDKSLLQRNEKKKDLWRITLKEHSNLTGNVEYWTLLA